jgi:hypothetical protein
VARRAAPESLRGRSIESPSAATPIRGAPIDRSGPVTHMRRRRSNLRRSTVSAAPGLRLLVTYRYRYSLPRHTVEPIPANEDQGGGTERCGRGRRQFVGRAWGLEDPTGKPLGCPRLLASISAYAGVTYRRPTARYTPSG